MGKVIVGMTMSLDGFVQDREGSVGALYPDFETLRETAPMQDAMQQTGAVVMGWKTFAMAAEPDLYAEHYEFQVPIFVVTHTPPAKQPKENSKLTFTFVTDGLPSAIAQAKAAAGAKDVTVVGGAQTIQRCLRAGLADELQVDIMPVLLGEGLRLFAALERAQIQLERVKVLALPAERTHLCFRIVK